MPARNGRNWFVNNVLHSALWQWSSRSNVERGGDDLIKPHGGQLVSTMVEDKRKDSILREVTKTIECSDRNACDVELIINGGFSPLRGFMSKKEFDSVVDNMKLTDGSTFGLPVVMDTHDPNVKPGDKVRNPSLQGTFVRF